jgi:ABC-type sugar transport system permease subunit
VNWLGGSTAALLSIILVDIWQWTPFTLLIFLSGLENLDADPYEAAVVDGASGWQILRYVTLPLLLPVTTVILLFRLLDAFKTFDIIYMVTGGGPANSPRFCPTRSALPSSRTASVCRGPLHRHRGQQPCCSGPDPGNEERGHEH